MPVPPVSQNCPKSARKGRKWDKNRGKNFASALQTGQLAVSAACLTLGQWDMGHSILDFGLPILDLGREVVSWKHRTRTLKRNKSTLHYYPRFCLRNPPATAGGSDKRIARSITVAFRPMPSHVSQRRCFFRIFSERTHAVSGNPGEPPAAYWTASPNESVSSSPKGHALISADYFCC